jgi:hypothetical protein
VLFVDRLGTTSAGGSTSGSTNGSLDTTNRLGYGTLRWCLTRTVPRTIIPLVSGLPDYNGLYLQVSPPYMTFAGQCAPSPGFYTLDFSMWSGQAGAQNYAKHHLIWHFGSFLGDFIWVEGTGDNFFTSGNYTFWANCSGMWGRDGSWDSTSGSGESGAYTSYWQCLSAEGLGETPYIGEGRGMLLDDTGDYTDITRTAFISNHQRNPLLLIKHATIANCLVYNYKGTAFYMQGGSGAIDTNIEQSLNMYHPTQNSIAPPIYRLSWVAGCNTYVNKVRQLFWEGESTSFGGALTSESQLYMPGQLPTDPNFDITSSRLTSSYPQGLQLFDLGTVGANDGKRETFARLVLDSCGPRPGDRLPVIQRVITYAKTRVTNAGGDYGTKPTSIAQVVALIPTVATNTIANPFAAQAEWGGRSVPTLAQSRDTPYTSGTFSDGKSRVGYTRLEEFLYEVHLLVMS